MNSKQKKTLNRILSRPEPSDLRWTDIEGVFLGLGAEIREGNGSRVRVKLNSAIATFHRPHPSPIAGKLLVKNVRKFLLDSGVSFDV